MSEERDNREVGFGEKGEAPDGIEVVALGKPQEEDEVGGRYRRWTSVVCPYCYSLNDILEETTQKLWFRCWNCSGTFLY